MVSLLDDVVVGLVLYGLGVDGRPGEGVVGVPDQTHRVDRLFHLQTLIIFQLYRKQRKIPDAC